MKKLSIFASIIFSASLAITGYSAFSVAKNATKVDATVGNYTTNASTYYSGITATSGTSLLGQLHDLMVTTHKTYTSYDDVGKNLYQQYLDADPNDSTKVIDFYSGYSMDLTWTPTVTGGYNREHLWCQSLSNSLWGETGGGADMHHLRPLEMTENSTRNNNPYGEVTSHTSTYLRYPKDKNKNYLTDYPGGYLQNGVWEPMDAKKGDVARIVLYVYMHYNTYSKVGGTKDGSTSSFFGTLPITNVMSCSSESAAFEMLVKWNKNDPVDSLETTRNNAAAGFQGNRNPFIDHPEYVDAIWGSTPVSNNPSLSMPGSATVTVGNTVNVAATLSNGSGTISYSSSNTNVATVSSSGVVTGKSAGSATITASVTVSGTKYTATCTVTVSAAATPSLTMPSTLNVSVGGTGNATATLSNGSGTISYTSSNTSVATVSSSGVVTGISAGSATITAKVTISNKTYSATCSVTVSASSGGLSVGFESSEGFTATTTYNNSTVKYWGNEGSQWGTYYGAPTSTTSYVISGSQSMQLRWYTKTNTSIPYTFTNFDEANISTVSFKAKATNGLNVKLSYSTNSGTSWTDKETFTLTTSAATYTSDISGKGANRIKFTIVLPSTEPTANSVYTMDDVEIKTSSSSTTYTADSFASEFLSTITCSGQGSVTSASSAWSSMSTKYSSLSTTYKSVLKAASANQSGSNIEKAMARYDYIIKKYGTSTYTNFIGRTIQSAPAVLKSNIDGNSDLVIIIVISSMTALLSGYYLFSKRKEQ